MAEDLRQRYAEALAEQFTWPSYRHRLPAIHERWADSPTAAPCLATLTGQYMGSFYVDEDGHPGMRRTTCAEVADAVTAVRDDELRAWRERAETAKAVLARVSAVHRVHNCEEDGHVLDRTPNPCANNGVCSCGQPGDRCPTRIALNEPQEEM